jgi:hypothetical protein
LAKPAMVRAAALGALYAAGAGCAMFDYEHAARAVSGRQVKLVLDTPDVQRLVTGAESSDRSSTGGLREQGRFLDLMEGQPAVGIPPGSYVRILERSHAVCTRQPNENPYFVKVRVTSGVAKGETGWGCLGVDIVLAHDMP